MKKMTGIAEIVKGGFKKMCGSKLNLLDIIQFSVKSGDTVNAKMCTKINR